MALPLVTFVFRPGATPHDNVFSDWALLMAALGEVEGRKILEFDDSVTSPCVVPPGSWNMRDVVWAGYGPRPGATRTLVVIREGAILPEWRMIGGQITIDNQATTTSPVSDFKDGPGSANHVHIGMRDDCGNIQLLNSGTAPLFDLGNPTPPQSRNVLFFCQNSLLNIRYRRTTPPQSKHALITHGGDVGLVINFIGQNQTGDKLVKSPAKALFGALSSSTQIHVDNINANENEFGPVTRIQRKVQPQPPLPPAQSHVQPAPDPLPPGELGEITLPNVLLRCDGNGIAGAGFTVTLPKIAGGFLFSAQDPMPLYTGGSEIVIAEVAGGNKLEVAASPGDTIDGSTAAIKIKRKGARTLISDGADNWITTAIA
jgi:hypothetical protein